MLRIRFIDISFIVTLIIIVLYVVYHSSETDEQIVINDNNNIIENSKYIKWDDISSQNKKNLISKITRAHMRSPDDWNKNTSVRYHKKQKNNNHDLISYNVKRELQEFAKKKQELYMALSPEAQHALLEQRRRTKANTHFYDYEKCNKSGSQWKRER